MHWPWMTGAFGWWGWWMIPMVLFWGLVAWGIVYVVSRLVSPGGDEAAAREETALEVLKRRYARGEIGREEYEQKRRDLA